MSRFFKKKCCANCRYLITTEDNYDANSPTGRGRRVWAMCHLWLKESGKGPIMHHELSMLTVLERSCNPKMRKETSYIHKFRCNFWKKKSNEQKAQT